jgi:hypothetical protein
MTEPLFDWYKLVQGEEELEQGDMLNSFPVIIPKISNDPRPEAKAALFDVIVMTQSCDLAKMDDNELVVFCPRYDCRETPPFNTSNGWGKLIRDRYVYAHLLDKCDIEGYELDYQVVNLRQIYTSPLGFVNHFAQRQGRRVRLLPPYRERLAQAFANQFMRIGISSVFPRKYPYKP